MVGSSIRHGRTRGFVLFLTGYLLLTAFVGYVDWIPAGSGSPGGECEHFCFDLFWFFDFLYPILYLPILYNVFFPHFWVVYSCSPNASCLGDLITIDGLSVYQASGILTSAVFVGLAVLVSILGRRKRWAFKLGSKPEH